MQTIVIDPVTRIEGHMKVEVVVDDGRVKEARTTGTLFRGIEIILKGRHPADAQRITQRVCGVCPTAHATASALTLDAAFGIADQVPHNGRVLRNLILGCNFLQSHILHFFTLAALDYVDVAALALRLACVVLARPPRRRLLVLDEPFRFVRGRENRARTRRMLTGLAGDLGFQIILCTDIPEYRLGMIVEMGERDGT